MPHRSRCVILEMQTADAALTDVYKALMAMLDTEEKRQLPARAKSFCDEVPHTSGGIYQSLEGCIRNELDAASSSQDIEF